MPPSLWEDFIDIFYAPSQVFARRERGTFWIPTLVVSVLTSIVHRRVTGGTGL